MEEKPNIKNAQELIIGALKDKACNKQKVYKLTFSAFETLKKVLREIATELSEEMSKIDTNVEIKYESTGTFEARLKFSGDVLVFNMHTNIFNFQDDHYIFKTSYVQEDQSRSYCGMIQIFNFLADSFKYNRIQDVGYLVGRIFINKDKHYFVEGKRQLGFLYNDFEESLLDKSKLKAIVESAILYSIEFDLLVPPYDEVKQLTLAEKIEQIGSMAIKTGKRLGFRFQADNDGK